MNVILIWKILFWIFILLVLTLVITFLFYKFYFQRDPERITPECNYLIAPADGEIQKIMTYNLSKKNIGIGDFENVEIKKKYLGRIKTSLKDVSEEGYIISIFMSPLDVHMNRAPVSGTILNQIHKNGSFHPAFKFWETMENEKNEILIEGNYKINNKNKTIKLKTIQIAGAMARRIESFVKKGDKITSGERIGRINLGSQVTIIVPKKIKLRIKEGDRVVAGETILADLI